ncbi:hypothetical protein [Streptomyces sp. NPDC050264]|uniref:hypothetical protein n=1 Tax=Streptomyces sp. NPDC050264 TaxID=3155038 RepID=UPI00341FBBED
MLEEEGVPYRVGQLISDFLLVPFLVTRAGGLALLRHQVAAAMQALSDLRVEEFPFPLPGLGIDMVWNPRLSDQDFIAWLRGLLFDVATHLCSDASLTPMTPTATSLSGRLRSDH